MKKIVGILAVAAVATSLFAADFTAGARIEGDVFNYDGAKEETKALMIKNANNPWNKPFTISVSGDNAGATWKFTDNSDGHPLKTSNYQIWFKPVDVVTVKLGNIAESMNTETINWGGRVLNYDSYGLEAVYAQDALTVALSFVPGEGNYFFTSASSDSLEVTRAKNELATKQKAYYAALVANGGDDTVKDVKDAADAVTKAEEDLTKAEALKDKDPKTEYEAAVKELNLFVQYGADFGTIKAMYDVSNNFKSNKIAVGYNNTFGDLSMFADAVLTIDSKVKRANLKTGKTDELTDLGAAVDAFVEYKVDALKIRAYVKGSIAKFTNFDKDTYGDVDVKGNAATMMTANGFGADNFQLKVLARVDYQLDAVNVFAVFDNANVMEKEYKDGDKLSELPGSVFVSTIKAGLNGSVGICGWEAAVQLDTGKGPKYDKVNVSVPVNFAIDF